MSGVTGFGGMEFVNAAGIDGESEIASLFSGQLQPFHASVEQRQSDVAPTEQLADSGCDPP